MSPARAERVFGREAIILGAVVAALVGIALAIGAAKNGSGYLFNSDAIYFRRVAEDPFGRGRALAALGPDVGVAYRYGRIFYPLASWILALGKPALVVWTMPIVFSLFVGIMVACAVEICRAAELPPTRGLLVLLVPAMWLSLPIVFSDPVFTAVLLLVMRLHQARRWRGARVAASALLLTREAMGIALVPLIWRDVHERGRREMVKWAASVVPLILWWAWIRERIGKWPLLDPAAGRRDAVSYPFGGVIAVLRHGRAVRGWLFAALIIQTVTVLWVLVLARKAAWFPLTQSSVFLAVLIVCAGPATVLLPVQLIRLMLPAQVLAVLASVAVKSRRSMHGPLVRAPVVVQE